jgi:hypothetical protein
VAALALDLVTDLVLDLVLVLVLVSPSSLTLHEGSCPLREKAREKLPACWQTAAFLNPKQGHL